jgi:hypothetical protein
VVEGAYLNAMPRYYFMVHDGGGIAADDFGLELPDLASARNEAVAGARSIMSDGVRQGELDLAAYIEIEDLGRLSLGRVTFREVLSIRE